MFNNIIGNDENKTLLNNTIKQNNISHSYMFVGTEGIGKFLFAKEFAKAVLCTSIENKPCNTCKSCETFENMNNPDIVIIDEKDESIKTNTIKELVGSVLEKPIQSSKKVYIINNSENMTKEAQNSLLKTLEEPPDYVCFILVTKNENLLLNTIRSRCIKIPFKKLTKDEIKQYFQSNNENVDEEIIDAFNGSIGIAIKLKDKKETYNKINIVLNKIENLNELQILKLKDDIFTDKDDVQSILEYINTIFYKKLLSNLSNSYKYQKCIEIIEETKKRLNGNSNYDMTIDNCLLEIERSLNSNG